MSDGVSTSLLIGELNSPSEFEDDDDAVSEGTPDFNATENDEVGDDDALGFGLHWQHTSYPHSMQNQRWQSSTALHKSQRSHSHPSAYPPSAYCDSCSTCPAGHRSERAAVMPMRKRLTHGAHSWKLQRLQRFLTPVNCAAHCLHVHGLREVEGGMRWPFGQETVTNGGTVISGYSTLSIKDSLMFSALEGFLVSRVRVLPTTTTMRPEGLRRRARRGTRETWQEAPT